MKNILDKIITESINKVILESEMSFDELYELKEGTDIVKYVMDYINWSQRGQRDPSFSILASKLHNALMWSLNLNHDDENDRKTFVKILNYCKNIDRTVGIQAIKLNFDSSPWIIITKSDNKWENEIFLDVYDFKDDSFDHSEKLRYGIAYKTNKGVRHLDSIHHPGSYKGSCGYVTTSAAMTDEMKQRIYGMGLIPALFEDGSFHENWVYSVGILPKFLTQIKNDEDLKDVIFFDCKF